jgi:uroporphyrin-3 C-methyltransferase
VAGPEPSAGGAGAPASAAVAAPSGAGAARWAAAGAAALAALATAALVLAWNTQQRVKSLESELVRRQQDSGNLANEARVLARQAELGSREAVAKIALLEARVAETAMQRSQFEELIQSLARSRDENVLADVEAAIRVAMQQSAITGSVEPLVQVLRQSDERLARYNQPRLERVRRAVAQDLERARSAGNADIALLTLRLDELIRQVDDLPLLSAPERRRTAGGGAERTASAAHGGDAAGPAGAAAAASSSAAGRPPRTASAPDAVPSATWLADWRGALASGWQAVAGRVWTELRGLVRVTRIDQPEAMLVAPEQAYFLRENLKLRLLNARVALLSRQFDTAQLDLREAKAALDRYFDRSARRTIVASESLRQVAAQARTVNLPRPDATLAAIAAASAGR